MRSNGRIRVETADHDGEEIDGDATAADDAASTFHLAHSRRTFCSISPSSTFRT